MKHSVKLFILFAFLCFNCFSLHAQQKHFVYVQSEDKQPFAIILNGKVYSSSDYGYIIIPRLDDGDYTFRVSFPMNKFPEQSFSCTVNKKDAGYTLKTDNNTWVLENLQTKTLVASGTAAPAQNTAFGNMLADVVNDSNLTQKNIAEPAPASNNTAEVAAVTTAGVVAADAATADAVRQPQKISETKLDTGTSMLFVDKTETGADTISVFVPAESTNANMASEKTASAEPGIQQPSDNVGVVAVPLINDASQTNTLKDTATVAASGKTMPDTIAHEASNPFYKSEQTDNNTSLENNAATITTAAAAAATATSGAVKEDCENTISDEDFNKLKRKMFVQRTDNQMIQYAVKYMNKKCISTAQVKVLGGLFVSDDGRYNLYDALYQHVYDYGNYPQLASQIVDPYYKKRFAAMLR